jgi:hypothetical protein
MAVTYSVAAIFYTCSQKEHRQLNRRCDMIWLQMEEENGRALYLDIQRVEQRQQRERLCYSVVGMLGNGLEEGEVLIEVGSGVEVIFVDEWMPGRGLPAFVAEAGRETVSSALADELSAIFFCVENFPSLEVRPRRQVTGYRADGRWMALRPRHYAEQLELPMEVGETAPAWNRSVA